MLVSERVVGKLQRSLALYKQGIFVHVADLEVRYVETHEHLRQPPSVSALAKPGMTWGTLGSNAWFVASFEVPKSLEGETLYLAAETGGSESLSFLNGEPIGALDSYSNALDTTNANDDGPIGYAVVKGHATRLLCPSAKAGDMLEIAIESYAGHPNPGCHPHDRSFEESCAASHFCHYFQSISIRRERPEFKAYVYDLLPLLQLVTILGDDSLRKAKIYQGLAEIYAVMPQFPDEESEGDVLGAIKVARSIMKPLLEATNGTTAPLMGLIGHSHMDTAWLWPVRETIRKCARTFAAALEMTDRYEEFKWLQTCPIHSEFIRDNYPGLFERIQRAVAEGAWEVNGGGYVEPDCNMPCGEALVRNFLMGDSINRDLFGKSSNCFWQPDVFGYSAALPQIMKGVGIDYFLTTKLSWNDTNQFPYDTFQWKGIDGSSVISHFNVTHCRPDPLTLNKSWSDLKHKDIQDRRLVAYGLGDGGSGVQFQMLETARRCKDLEGCPRTEYTEIGTFMDDLGADLAERLPVWSGELYLEGHRGVMTTQPDLKRGNRQAELLVRQAEWICSLESVFEGKAYPTDTFRALWKKLLLNQFHDILPGTSIAQVHEEAKRDFDAICSDSLALSGRGSNPGDSLGREEISLINTRSWARGTFRLVGFPEGLGIVNDSVAIQSYVDIEGCHCLYLEGVDLAPMSARTFLIKPVSDCRLRDSSLFEWSDPVLRTPLVEIRFGDAGEIVYYKDHSNGREWLPGGGSSWNRFITCVDVPSLWDNWDLDAEDASMFHPVGKVVSRKALEDGPLLFRLEQVIELSPNSRIRQICSIAANERAVTFENELDWGDSHRFLKARFDAPMRANHVKHEIQYGFVERPTHANTKYDRARFEHCQHRWSDLSDGHSGLAIFNDSKYGVSTEESAILLSLVKSGTHPDHRGSKGRHYFSYSVNPYEGHFCSQEVIWPAHDFNDLDFWRWGCVAWDSFLVLDQSNASIDWIKRSEDGQGLVVRIYETEGAQTELALTLPVGNWSVAEANMLEVPLQDLEVTRGTVRLRMRGFEVVTLKLIRL